MIARGFFLNNLITDSCDIDNVHELFIKVYLEYSMVLENSLIKLQNKGVLKSITRNFYNYILLDANLFYRLVDTFNTSGLGLRPITLYDLYCFKEAIIYIGKGKHGRKYYHLKEAIKLFDGNMKIEDINNKYIKIVDVWKKGGGILVIQVFSDTDNYLALNREFSMIKSAGPNLTNAINGSVHGLMKNEWTSNEILNFGEMLIYFSFYQCLLERPIPTYAHDMRK